MSSKSTAEVDEIIANGHRLVSEAQAALQRMNDLFAEHNIDPQEAVDFLRQHGGEAAVQAMRDQVQAEIAQLEEEAQRRRMHQPKVRSAGSRPRVRSNLV